MSEVSGVLKGLADAVIIGDPKLTEELAKKAITANIDPLIAIEKGLTIGIRKVGELFERGQLFLPDLMMAAEAMKGGLRALEPILRERKEKRKFLARFLIGTVEGDIHDIGKNIVSVMLDANGFEVIDLGVDVPTQTFIEKVKELQPDILGLSALLYTTMLKMEEVIDRLKEANLRNQVKVIVGGAPVTEEIARKIGADEYGEDAVSAVIKAKKLMEERI